MLLITGRSTLWRRIGVVASAVLVTATAMSTASASTDGTSGPPTECTGTIGGESVDRLIVPAGATCTLAGTDVRGDVVLAAAASLVATDATIGGSVRATDGPHRVKLIGTDIGRNVMVTGATGRIVIGPDGCRVDPVAGNNVILRDNSGTIAICLMSIGENLMLSGNSNRIGVFDNVVGNNVLASDNSGTVTRFRDNVVGISGGGNMLLKDNNSQLVVKRNDAGNHISCDGNSPAPRGAKNTADNGLTGQCATLG